MSFPPPLPFLPKHYLLPQTFVHPICLTLISSAEPLPSTLLFATISRTWTHACQLHPHCSLLLPLAPVLEPQKSFPSPRRLPFSLSFFQDLIIPMTLVQTQTTCGTLHLEANMTGYNPLKQAVRTKAGAARYIVISFFALVCFCRFASRIMSSESNVPNVFFFFCAQHHLSMDATGDLQDHTTSPGSFQRFCSLLSQPAKAFDM